MRSIAALLTDRTRLARVQRAFRRHATVTPSESWGALANYCTRRAVNFVILDLFAIAGVSTEAAFEEVRGLRRGHPATTLVVYMDVPATRAHDLFDAGRLDLDGLVLVGVDDSAERFRATVAGAEASAVARLMRPALSDVNPTVRDAASACVALAHQILTPDILSRRIGVSHRRLARDLADSGFPSIRRLIGWGRLIMAGRLLEDADEPGNLVARALGYSSGSGFRNAARRHLGVTPQAIREGGGASFVIAKLVTSARARAGRAGGRAPSG